MLYNHFQWLTLKGETRFAKCQFPLVFSSAVTLSITLSPKSSRLNYGISHNFHYHSVVTQMVTSLGISQVFCPCGFATNGGISYYIQLICHRLCKRTIGTLLATLLQHPKQNIAPVWDQSQTGAVFPLYLHRKITLQGLKDVNGHASRIKL